MSYFTPTTNRWLITIIVGLLTLLASFFLLSCARRTTVSAPTTIEARRSTAEARVLVERNSATLREQKDSLSRLQDKRDRADRKLIWLLEQ